MRLLFQPFISKILPDAFFLSSDPPPPFTVRPLRPTRSSQRLSLLAPQTFTPPTLETKKSLLMVTFQRGQLYRLRRYRRLEPTLALMWILASQLAWKLPQMEVTSGQNTDISS